MSNSPFIPGLCSLSSRVSLSQPCLPQGNDGPTQILPFLYLGSQQDALNHETLKKHNITYVLNLSMNCPKSDILQSDEHFLRIPVNDNYQEKLMPYFAQAFTFLEKVRERGAVVLIHCLAGISRSPTVAISYIMRHKKMGSDEAYNFVKSKRQSISPNFNFMGQLLEYEKVLRNDGVLPQQINDANASSFKEKQDFCPAKVPKSCSAMSLFSSLPTSLSTCSSTEESLPPNEHGKRGMGPAQCGNPERPGVLDGSPIDRWTRPVALGIKSRKPVMIPTSLGEELPSPSSELSKLSFSGALPNVPSIVNPCFVAENNVKPMAPSMTSCASVENPIFGKMVSSIPQKMETCRPFGSNKSFVPQRETEILSRSTNADFDRSFHSSSPPKSQPLQISQEPKKEIKGSPRSRFSLNLFALFRKPDQSSEKIARSQTASAGLSTFASRPDSLAEAGVAREKEAHSPPGTTSKMSDSTEMNSPESGFQEGYKTSPEDRDPDRTSIGSTSSHEIAVQ